MIDLKAMFHDQYRIAEDESAEILGQTAEERLWLYQIPGKWGHVFVQGRETLGAWTDRKRLFAPLLAIPGAKVLQCGDREMSVAFDPIYLEMVAPILALKRRVRLSEENRRRLIEAGSAFRFETGETRPFGERHAHDDPGEAPEVVDASADTGNDSLTP